MAAWRWLWWLWLWWSVAVVVTVVPEGEGGDHGGGGGWVKGTPECPSGCSCSIPRHVSCKAATKDSYPPDPAANTTKLVLEDYQTVPTHLLARLQNLQHLKISGSKLESLATIPALPHLRVLDVQRNNVGSLAGGHLQASWPGLTHLLLGNNKLTVLNDTDLSGLQHLEELDIRHNPLTRVGIGALRGLNALTLLDASQSTLPQLPHRWLADAPRLQYLNISRTGVHQLPLLVGQHLQVVDASHNSIKKLPVGFLTSAGNLEELLLHHNPLIHVAASALAGGSSLLRLDLHHTHLVNMDEFVFQGVPKLRELRLDHNPRLQRVEHGAFTGLHHLQHLGLAYTPNLTEIEEVAFSGLPHLRSLDLRDSSLSVLPHSVTKLVKHNTSVFLAGTALRCDCHHSWLPELLITSDISKWTGFDPLECRDGERRSARELAAYMASLNCMAPEPASPLNGWVIATKARGALLECNVTANPPHKVLWISAKHQVFRYNGSDTSGGDGWLSHQLQEAEGIASTDPRFQVLESGHLLIQDVQKEDVGWFKCFAYNSVGNTTVMAFLTLSDAPFRALYVESLLFGLACSALFLFITLLVQLINYLMDRLGCECCCCCKGRLSPKARQVRRLLESVEIYKTQQLERLRENYNGQVVSIKDSCYSQMDRIRDSYSSQSKNLKDLREYSTQGLTTIRDQYVDQVNNIRDYSMSQMNRVRENYVFQRHRIRKFSAHQLVRLRETYKYQQKTLNKVLENLPDLYLQNCRTGGCQRSDSILFDDALHGIDAYYKIDFLDTQSHHSSDYYTPASTLTRSYRSNRGQEPVRQHSRTSSNASSDFVEAQLWSRRESSTVGSGSPSRTFSGPGHSRSNHSRSLSAGGPAAFVADPVRVHKRSLSACHSSHRVSPVPESTGVPARITLREEHGGLIPPLAPSSVPTTPSHHPRRLVLEVDDGGAVSTTNNTNTTTLSPTINTTPQHPHTNTPTLSPITNTTPQYQTTTNNLQERVSTPYYERGPFRDSESVSELGRLGSGSESVNQNDQQDSPLATVVDMSSSSAFETSL